MFLRLLSLSAVSATITDCSKGQSLFTITDLGFYPDPAIKNSKSTVDLSYIVPEPGFPGGTASYSATYNFIPIPSTVEDICKTIACPIVPGPYNLSTSTTFPNLSGSLKIKIVWKDPNGVELLCAFIKTKV